MSYMLASEAALYCEGQFYGPNVEIKGTWRNDSREVCPSESFVALKGAAADGHMFIEDAVKNGAKILLVNFSEMEKIDIENPLFTDITFISAPDTTAALAMIAQSYLKKISPKVIGITGSVGKTTTRELIVAVLKEKHIVHGAIRSFNTVIGCSLTVLAMPPNTEILVLEFGTNNFGEIAEMVGLFSPDTVVITEVAPAHLEGFGCIEGVLMAKLEICTSKRIKNIIYNGDNFLLKENIDSSYEKFNRISIGYKENNSLKITETKMLLDESGPTLSVDYLYENKSFTYKANLFGIQHAYNIGFAVVLGKLFDVSDELIKTSLKLSQSIDGRGVLKKKHNNTWIVDESYNASPTSMEAAINNVIEISKAYNYKLYAILGGMRELGETSAEWHERILNKLKCFEKVALLGGEWYDEKLAIPVNMKRYRLFSDIINNLNSFKVCDSIILIKGSNSYGLNKVVQQLMEASNYV